jgi:signal transduction histidine kinase
MVKRERRLVQFLTTDFREMPQLGFDERMRHFLEASPESDLVEIDDAVGNRIYTSADSITQLERNPNLCNEPCLTTTYWNGHHLRVLTYSTSISGRSVRVILAGVIDEHYNILHEISVGFMALIPVVFVGSVIGGFLLSRRALAPVGAMTTQARRLSMSELNARIAVPNTGDELEELANAWNEMLTRLEDSAERITQFTADASHDLKSALTVTLANSELALRRERTPQRYQECLRVIASQSTHMLSLLDDLLLAARSGWTAEASDRTDVDLLEIVREIYDAHSAAALVHNHDLRIESVTDKKLDVHANRALLRRLINILVDNAIKYTPRGGIITLRISGKEDAGQLEVIDNGIGIAPEMQEKVFERLVRISPERTQGKEQGHGLGLSIARWIATVHGFRLTVESVPNEGSNFKISFPHRYFAVDATLESTETHTS